MYGELQPTTVYFEEGMVFTQRGIEFIEERARRRMFQHVVEHMCIMQGMSYSRQGIRYIEFKTGSGVDAGVQRGIGYIKQGIDHFQQAIEYIQHEGKCIEKGNRLSLFYLLRKEKEHAYYGMQCIHQGLQYIQGRTISGLYPELPQGHRFEDQQGTEYVQDTDRSGSTNPVRQQEHRFENQQGMEYIRQADRSISDHVLQKECRFEDWKGMEYIREAQRSLTYHVLQQQNEYEDQQGIEYIQQANRSITYLLRRN